MPEEISTRRITTTKKKLVTYLQNNPYSDIEAVGKYVYISRPWGDASLILVPFRGETKKLFSALNCLILPPMFSAIYHPDTNIMDSASNVDWIN